MSKRIPDQVSGDAQHQGKQDGSETGGAAELEFSQLPAQSLLHAAGQQVGGGPLEGGVKQPERKNGGWEREFDNTRELVAQAPTVGVADNVREVRSHAAHHERRPHQVQFAKGQHRGDVGHSEWHRVKKRVAELADL